MNNTQKISISAPIKKKKLSISYINRIIKKNYSLILILLLFFALRIPALNQDIYGDEYVFYYYSYATVEDAKAFGFASELGFYPSHYVPIIFYEIAMDISHSVIAIRIVSLLFGLGTLLIGMRLLESFFNKTAAVIFGVLYAIMPWAVFTSVLLDNDGTIISFIFLILMYYTLKFIDKSHREKSHDEITRLSKRYMILIGAISGFLISLKLLPWIFIIAFNAMFIAYIVFIDKYDKSTIEKNKRHKHKFYDDFKIFFRLLLFLLLGILAGVTIIAAIHYVALGGWGVYQVPYHYLKLINNANNVESASQLAGNPVKIGGFGPSFFFGILICVIFISPIILLLLLNVSVKIDSKIKRDYGLKYRYIVLITLFHIIEILGMLYMYNAASLTRYAAFLMIPVFILNAIILSKFIDEKKIIQITLIGLLLSIAYFLVDLLPHRILNFYPKSAWIENVVQFKWNFLVPINGASGPIGLYVSFYNIVFPFIICGIISIFMFFLIHSKNYSNKIFSRSAVIFLVIVISYALYVSIQFAYTPTSPSINNMNVNIRTECATESYYTFRNSPGIAVQTNQSHNTKVKNINFEDENDPSAIAKIIAAKEHVCISDFPQIDKGSLLWKELTSKCVLHKSYYDKGYLIGYWFDC